MSIKLGIVGTNFISDWLVQAVKEVAGITIMAVYSRSYDTGELFANKHQIPNIFTDYEQFIHSDIDSVYIASPSFAHHRQTIAALNAGKHVLCEKVMGLNEAEVKEMIDCAITNQKVLLEAMRPNFDPAYQILKQHLPRIGTLRRVCLEYCQYSSRYDRYKEGVVLNAFDPSLGNAAIMDIGVYCIHTMVNLFGKPLKETGISLFLENGFEGSGNILMEYESMIGEVAYSKITDSVNHSIFQGEKGSILINPISSPNSMEIVFRSGERETVPLNPVSNNMIFEVQAFVNLINSEEIHHPYHQISLDTIRIIENHQKNTRTCW